MRRLWILSSLALVACGSSHAAPSDAATDAFIADAGSDAGRDAGRDAATDSGVMDSGVPACPADIVAADGTACSSEGQSCGDCPGDPCSFCNQLVCMSGTWVRIEAFPAPCHECGDAGPCVSISHYCDHSFSDVGGVPDSYQCLPLPDACLGDLSCTCLEMSVAADRCTGMGTAGLTVEHFGG